MNKKYILRSHPEFNSGSQSGRSMVEMLGVLAVIGVLSVAGIAGYSIAMRSYRTNEIVNAASMFYVLAMAQNAGNGPSGTSAVNYGSVGGTDPSGATLAYNPTDKKITITFDDPKDCTMALNKLGDKATANTCSTSPYTLTVTLGDVSTSTTPETPTPETPTETRPEPKNCRQQGGDLTVCECEGDYYYYAYYATDPSLPDFEGTCVKIEEVEDLCNAIPGQALYIGSNPYDFCACWADDI